MACRQNTARPPRQRLPPGMLLLAWLCACLSPGAGANPRLARELPSSSQELPLPEGVSVSTVRYAVPALTLRDATGHAVDLKQLFQEPGPVVVNFIFTSCPEICPVMTGTQLQLQRRLRDKRNPPRFISITLDPEQDTPTVLADYATRFGAEWMFLTGRRDDILKTLQAFGAWRGNKMNHAAVTLMRSGPEEPWTRIEGLAPVGTMVAVWQKVARQ